MKRVCIAIATLLVACQGLAEAPSDEASTTEPEVKTKVMIEIGHHSFAYRKLDDEGEATTEKTRLPEVPIGQKFKVKVRWTRNEKQDALLSLRNFRYQVLASEALTQPQSDPDSPLWKEGGEAGLLLEREGKMIPVTDVGFKRPASGDVSEATLLFEAIDFGSEARLIFFDVELKEGDEQVFLFDPPWVGKRGGG